MIMQNSKGKITIRWQRLFSDGGTCERCSSTEEQVEKAAEKLQDALPRLGIDVELEKEKLSEEEFKENPKASNRIFINDVALEDLINANVGSTECCDVCGDEECRTVIVGGEEHEVVPFHMIVNAAMTVAEEIFTGSCCGHTEGTDSCCS